MKNRKFYFLGVTILFLVSVIGLFMVNGRQKEDNFPVVVHAAADKTGNGDNETSEDLKKAADRADEAKKRLQEEREQLSEEVSNIKLKKNNVIAYIQELDEKSTKLAQRIEKNRRDIKDVRAELDKLSLSKTDAVIQRDSQYDTMKKRIRYLYENGNEEYLQILLESKSLSDLYSKAEYVSKMTEYDNNMLSKYQETCELIEDMQLMMENKLSELKDRKESLKLEKKSLNKLIGEKTKKLDEYDKKIGKSEDELNDYASQIAAKENEMEELLEKQRQKAAKEEAEAKKNKDDNKTGDGKTDGSKNDTPNNKDDGQNDSSSDDNSGSDYRWPLNVAGVITSYFGYRTSPTAGASSYHKGIDIAVPTGTTVVAARSGTVITASYAADAGNYVCISHGDGAYTYYMHCSSLSVKVGEKVSKGQAVALSGSTGVSTGPHLHFAIYKDGNYVNPLNYVNR